MQFSTDTGKSKAQEFPFRVVTKKIKPQNNNVGKEGIEEKTSTMIVKSYFNHFP